ncbi:MAG: hypothetical protein EPN22_13285 [Nitrospirae bacterium]|nr:MAG: hypothetical protein EPN22_13285 [Nitrospirota bacterium]
MKKEKIVCDYTEAALKYRPNEIKCLFIGESPPAYKSEDKKSYFYFEENPGNDILFATLIFALYDKKYKKADRNKAELLNDFRNGGFFLMDTVEYPINRLDGKNINSKQRKEIIGKHTPDFLARLNRLKRIFSPSTGIIIIKKLNYEILAPILTKHKFKVLNNNKIDFPKYYWDNDTVNGVRKAIQP